MRERPDKQDIPFYPEWVCFTESISFDDYAKGYWTVLNNYLFYYQSGDTHLRFRPLKLHNLQDVYWTLLYLDQSYRHASDIPNLEELLMGHFL